jgi:hypothetical protein
MANYHEQQNIIMWSIVSCVVFFMAAGFGVGLCLCNKKINAYLEANRRLALGIVDEEIATVIKEKKNITKKILSLNT